MKVGLVAQGDPASALDLANGLHKLGIAVTLYLSHAHITKETGDPDQPLKRLYEVGLVPPECCVRLIHFLRRRDLRSVDMIRKMAQTLRSDGIDLAHIVAGPDEFWLSGLACLISDIPVVSTMVVPKPNVGDLSIVTWGSNMLLARSSNMLIVNGADQVQRVHKSYGLPFNRIAYVPLGARMTSVKWRHQGQPEEPATVLFFGRASPHKGLEYLIRAQPLITLQVPQARIVIVGHGPEIDRCRPMIKDLPRFEIHEGYVTSDLMASFFEKASLVALPYLSASTSGILLTSYGFGKPVVATNVGCLPEYVQDGVTGILVPPSNVAELSNAIIRLLLDDARRHKMGETAKQWVEEKEQEIVQKTLSVYERASTMHKVALIL